MKHGVMAAALAVFCAPALAQTAPGAQELARPEFGAPAQPAPPAQSAAEAAARTPAAQPDPTADLSPRHLAGARATVGGRYRSAGQNVDGSPYEGEAEIAVVGRDRCRLSWRTGKQSVQRGICMRSGFVFVAAYQFREGAVGLVTYEIQPDGSLKGMWTIAGTDGRGSETLTPAR